MKLSAADCSGYLGGLTRHRQPSAALSMSGIASAVTIPSRRFRRTRSPTRSPKGGLPGQRRAVGGLRAFGVLAGRPAGEGPATAPLCAASLRHRLGVVPGVALDGHELG